MDLQQSKNKAVNAHRIVSCSGNDQYQTLQELADKQNISLSDALHQAINISKVGVDANEDKDTRVLIDRGGKIQEPKIVR